MKVCVIGAGSWGTALASHLAFKGIETVLYARDPLQATAMQHKRVNEKYLPGQCLPEKLLISANWDHCITSAEHILISTPSHSFAQVLSQLQKTRPQLDHIAWATKGLDHQTGRFLHEIVPDMFGPTIPMILLTGPSFAKEIMAQKPTAITIAHNGHLAIAETFQHLFHSPTLRAYTCSDLVGAEIGGAVKNVLAIAAGISDGLGFGMNAKAGLMTRGLAEMIRLGKALNAQLETLIGLSGLGDLILTCSDNQSRNRRLGLALGEGKSLQAAVKEIGQVVEGIPTTRTIYQLAQKQQIEMPITEQMYHVLFENLAPMSAVKNLFNRDPGEESF